MCLQAVENFAWNIRVLQGQADLLLQAKKECQEYIRQVKHLLIFIYNWKEPEEMKTSQRMYTKNKNRHEII